MTPHEAAVYVLTGHEPPDVTQYALTVSSLQDYFNYAGIRWFTAKEFTTPHHPDIAAHLGIVNLLPKQEYWHKAVALAALADRLRTLIVSPIMVRNWWRPETPPYNRLVGGAPSSDHIEADAIDMDFKDRLTRGKAERYLLSLYNKNLFDLSLGLGARTIHMGIYSFKGRRQWKYSSYG